MKKILIILLISIVALFFIEMNNHAFGDDMGMKNMTMQKASNLIGATVKNQGGETLGKIKDLSIGRNGNVRFAILSQSSMMGMGEKLTAVPMMALSIEDEKKVILNISKERLSTAPSFDKKNWPDMTDRQFSEDTYKFYGIRPMWKEKTMEKEMKDVMPMEQEMMEMKPMKKQKAPGYGY